MIQFRNLVGVAFCTVVLTACGGDKNASSAGDTSSSSSTKGKVVYSIVNKKVSTRGNPARPEQGFGCSIGMTLSNKTKREISLVQILKYTAVTSRGNMTDDGTNFRLQPNEVTDRAAIYVKGASCDDIEKIIIERVYCKNASVNAMQPDAECGGNVVFKGSKKIKIDVAEGALEPLVTVTP